MALEGWRLPGKEAVTRGAIMECSAVRDIEYTALQALRVAEKKLKASGISLWIAGLNPEVLKIIKRSPLGEALGQARMFFNLRDAVQAYETKGAAI